MILYPVPQNDLKGSPKDPLITLMQISRAIRSGNNDRPAIS